MHQKTIRVLAVSLLIVTPLVARAQSRPLDPAAVRSFEAFVERQMERDRMTGLSVAVLEGGALWARGFGLAEVENSVPATEKSSYRMASVTKPMTAVAAMRLAELGGLDLDADVRRYVPYFPDKGNIITTRQLLSHLGGISHYRNYRVEGNIRDPKTTRESIAIFEDFDLVNEPGTTYAYSSYGYNLAGAAIEGASGKSYGDVMRELVWKPAGMNDTRLDSPTDIIPHRVTGYRLDGDELKRSDFVDISSRFAAGGTRSTVVDMVRFASALHDGKLLNARSLDQMWWPAQTSDGRWIDYGLGWSVHSVNGHYQVAHSGSQQEARTLLVYLPGRDLAIAFASNFEGADFRPYRDYLYWLLTGEVSSVPQYAADPMDGLTLFLADRLVDSGGMYFEKYERAKTTDRGELQRAFRYVNDAMRLAAKDPAAARKRISEGMHPKSGEPVVVAGSWIAAHALHGEGAPDLFRSGAIAIVNRYVALSRSRPAAVGRHRLDRATERRVAELARAWDRVWTIEAKTALVDPPPVEKLEAILAGRRGSRVAPSHARALVEEVENAFRRGDIARAARISSLAAENYPADHAAAGAHGIVLTLSGKEAEGESWLRRSRDIDADGYASAARLAGVARQVHRTGQRDRALALVRTALRVHPGAEALVKADAALRRE